jgi:hypothetical protein
LAHRLDSLASVIVPHVCLPAAAVCVFLTEAVQVGLSGGKRL